MADPNTPDLTKYVTVDEMNRRVEDAVAKALDKSKIGLDSAGNKFSTGISGFLDNMSGPAGKAIAGFTRLGAALGTVTGVLMQFADKAIESADAVFNMYNNGVVIALDQLTPAAVAFGTNIDGINKLMTKHAQVVATMGIERTMKLGDTMRTMTRNGTDLGMTTEQAADALLNYTQILSTTTNLQRFTNSQLTTNAIQFANALNEAAQATGKNRDQIAQEVKNRLQQNDAALIMAGMTEQQRQQIILSTTRLQEFNKNTSTAGSVFIDQMIKFRATDSTARVSPEFRQLLAVTGTLGDFSAFAREQDPEKQALMVQAMLNKMSSKVDTVIPQLGGKNSPMAEMLGNLVKAVIPGIPGQEPGPAPIDESARFLKDAAQTLQQGADTLSMAANDLAVSALLTAGPVIEQLMTGIDLYKGEINKGSSNLAGNPFSPDDIVNFFKNDFVKAAAAAGGAGIASLLMGSRSAATAAGGAAAADTAAVAASESVLSRVFSRVMKSLGLVVAGEVADQVGDVVKSTGYDKTGSAISAGGVITADALAAMAATKGAPGWLRMLAGGGGALVGAYQEFDNIQNLLGTPQTTPTTESTTDIIPTAEQPDTLTYLINVIEQQNSKLQSQIQILETGSIMNNNQNKTMLEKMDLLIKQITTLTDEVSEQTNTLRNAYSRGAGNVYP